MNELALFAGAGGGILGGKLLGWRTVCAVEINVYAASVLISRQNDGLLTPFPIWDDVCTFDGKPWKGIVDVVSGGFPCQDISVAGKGEGITGERSGLWKEFARIICEVQPRFVFVENSPALTIRGLSTALWDLARLGYNARWGVLSAENVEAPHKRERLWIVANNSKVRRANVSKWEHKNDRNLAKHKKTQPLSCWNGLEFDKKTKMPREEHCCPPIIWRMDDGLAFGVDRLAAIGNGQVPQVAKLAWEILSEGM